VDDDSVKVSFRLEYQFKDFKNTDPEILKFLENSFHESREENNLITNMCAEDQMDEMSFWVLFIEKYVNRMIYKDYFISLNNYDGILKSPTYNKNPNHEEYKHDQETITFVMLDQLQRIKAWKNATLEKKNDYWIGLGVNHELLSQ
jgi:hypothetical protein